MSEGATTPDRERLMRCFYEAINRRDVADGVARLFAPDASYHAALRVVEGHEAIARVIEDWIAPYEESEIDLEGFRELRSDVTVCELVQRSRPTGSSRFVEFRYVPVSTWTDGLVERLTIYIDIDEARAAAERLAEERG
jgi:hypothetical protein